MANSGDVQIALIQQRNDAPSVYKEFLDAGHDQGTVIEISDISGPKGQFFSYIRQVALDWHGSDPIRGSS
jgi:hypothetical protein